MRPQQPRTEIPPSALPALQGAAPGSFTLPVEKLTQIAESLDSLTFVVESVTVRQTAELKDSLSCICANPAAPGGFPRPADVAAPDAQEPARKKEENFFDVGDALRHAVGEFSGSLARLYDVIRGAFSAVTRAARAARRDRPPPGIPGLPENFADLFGTPRPAAPAAPGMPPPAAGLPPGLPQAPPADEATLTPAAPAVQAMTVHAAVVNLYGPAAPAAPDVTPAAPPLDGFRPPAPVPGGPESVGAEKTKPPIDLSALQGEYLPEVGGEEAAGEAGAEAAGAGGMAAAAGAIGGIVVAAKKLIDLQIEIDKAVIYLPDHMEKFGQETLRSTEYLRNYNAEIAGAFARMEAATALRNIQVGAGTEVGTATQAQALSRLQDAMVTQTVGTTNMTTGIGTLGASLGVLVAHVTGPMFRLLGVIGKSLAVAAMGVDKATAQLDQIIARMGMAGKRDNLFDMAEKWLDAQLRANLPQGQGLFTQFLEDVLREGQGGGGRPRGARHPGFQEFGR